MAHWNHRVIRHPNSLGEPLYGIHETFYTNDGKVKLTGSAKVVSNSIEGLREVLQMMLKALDTPVIDQSKKKDGG